MTPTTTTLTSAALARELITSNCTLEDLIRDYAASAEQIAETLYSDEFQTHQKLRLHLALAQAKLQAASFLPACTAKLFQLTDSQKPEVARRAAMALMGIAGLPTRVAPVKSQPEPQPEPEADDNQNDDQGNNQDNATDQTDTQEDNTDETPNHTEPNPEPPETPAQYQQRRLLEQNREMAARHADHLRDFNGIELFRLDNWDLCHIAVYLKAYFHAAGIPLAQPTLIPSGNKLEPSPLPTIPPSALPAHPRPNTNQNPENPAPFAPALTQGAPLHAPTPSP